MFGKSRELLDQGFLFYVGQGTHQENSRYPRAYAIHLDCNQTGRISYAQKKANKLARLGSPHVVEILYDDLTQAEADYMEKTLISRLGRKHIRTGILYNLSAGGDINPMKDPLVKSRHYAVTQTQEFSNAIKAGQTKADTFNADYRAKKSIETTERLNDPVRKAEWYSKFATPENREKIKRVQSDLKGIKLEWQGLEYRSKKELARFLGISSQLLNYRLKNNIPLDLVPDKGNNPNKAKNKPRKKKHE